MNVENKFARLMRNSGPARVLVPIGIILLVVGIILMGMKTDTFQLAEGTVTEVTESRYDEEQKTQLYDVGVSYTVDGKTYTGTFPDMNGTFKAGDAIKVYYNPENPENITNSKMTKLLPIAMIVLGIAAAAYGIFRTVKAFQKSKQLDQAIPGKAARADFDGFRKAPGVKEIYCLYDGQTLRPGYYLEDAGRNVLFEGKMLKNALVGARTFEFTDHTTGSTTQHDVGHTVTQSFNNEVFSAKSSFKFDGENIWDVLHNRGLRLATDVRSKFPRVTYQATRDGDAFALIETSSKYVHEEDEAQHSVAIPVGRYYYRIWTNSDDLETIFLTVFAVSETEQTMVE